MDFSITASEVGTLITYVAPGFLVQLGYRMKFPAPERSAGSVLIVSLVLSLPLVAIADAVTTKLLHASDRPLAVGFALALTAGSFVLGYIVATLREATWTRRVLAFFDYWAQPESSIYAQTLSKLDGAAEIEVKTLDGTRLRGVPTIGPLAKDDGIDELHLSNVRTLNDQSPDPTTDDDAASDGWSHDENWKSVIIPLDQVSFVALVKDPMPQGDWKSYKHYWADLKRSLKRADKHQPAEATGETAAG